MIHISKNTDHDIVEVMAINKLVLSVGLVSQKVTDFRILLSYKGLFQSTPSDYYKLADLGTEAAG